MSNATWNRVHDSLMRTLAGPPAAFEPLKHACPMIAGFLTPQSLVLALRRRSLSAVAIDTVYRQLILACRDERTGHARLARDLVWIGMWPALDALYKRGCRANGDGDSLASEIGIIFSRLLRETKLSGVTRLVATLALNAERELIRGAQRERRWQDRHSSEAEPQDSDEGCVSTTSHRLAWPEASGDQLQRELTASLGSAGTLFFEYAVAGLTVPELAERHNLPPQTVRRRLDLTRETLRSELAA